MRRCGSLEVCAWQVTATLRAGAAGCRVGGDVGGGAAGLPGLRAGGVRAHGGRHAAAPRLPEPPRAGDVRQRGAHGGGAAGGRRGTARPRAPPRMPHALLPLRDAPASHAAGAPPLFQIAHSRVEPPCSLAVLRSALPAAERVCSRAWNVLLTVRALVVCVVGAFKRATM